MYIHEAVPTTTPPPQEVDSIDLLNYLAAHPLDNGTITNPQLRQKFLQLSEGLVELKTGSSAEIYIATGIVSGIVIVILVILIALVFFNKRKRSMSPVPVPSSNATSSFREVEERQPDVGQVSFFQLCK